MSFDAVSDFNGVGVGNDGGGSNRPKPDENEVAVVGVKVVKLDMLILKYGHVMDAFYVC